MDGVRGKNKNGPLLRNMVDLVEKKFFFYKVFSK